MNIKQPSAHQGIQIVLVTIVLAALVSAQPQSSLQGRELQPVTDLGAVLQSLASNLFGAGGRIERVVVVDDGPMTVTVTVTHSGLKGARIAGQIRDRNRDPIRAIAPARADIESSSGEAQLSFRLRTEMATAPQTHSGYLRLLISSPSHPVPATVTYVLPKTFVGGASSSPVSGAGATVTNITPKPVGTAAKLGAKPDYETAPTPQLRLPRKPVLKQVPAPQGKPSIHPDTVKKPNTAIVQKPNTTIVQKPNTAIVKLPPSSKKPSLPLHAFKWGIRPEDKKFGAQGPAAIAVDLFEDLAVDDVGLTGDEILSLSPILFQDQNADSGIFYFVPRAYRTEWTPETGYGLRMLYGAAKGADAGEVAIAARLDAGIDLAESKLANDLLAAYAKRHPKTKFTAVRPLPIDAVAVSLASGLTQYSIPAEKIATVAISDVLGQVEISCVTDAITKESLQLALVEDVGLSGAVTFTPAGGKLGAQQIPARLRLADADTFGTIAWKRDEPFHNRSLYPLTLTYLHALIINPKTNKPVVYSWDLGNAQIAPGARVEWNGSQVPSWIDRDAKRLWVQYRPVATCRPCDQRVIAEITGGVVATSATELVFRTITPLAETGAYELTVRVRSRFFDPEAQQVQERSIVLGADGQDFPIGPLYIGEQPPGTSIGEYAIDVAMKNGTVHKAQRWLRVEGLRVLIGTSQIKESVGLIPSAQGGGQ